MIILGLLVAVIGFLLGIEILWVLGLALLIIGLVLLCLGSVGRPVGGRRWYY